MRYRISGDGWEQQFEVQRGPLGREWQITPPDSDPVAFHVERLEAGVFRLTIGDVTHTLTLLPAGQVSVAPRSTLLKLSAPKTRA